MKNRLKLGALLLAFTFPMAAMAQEAEYSEGGEFVQITTMSVAPSDVPAFEGAVGKLVKAAGEAGLGAEFGWMIWNDMFTYAIVSFAPNLAFLENSEEEWMKQFADTPGQATLAQAFQELDQLDITMASTEVYQGVPNWSYEPANPVPSPYAQMMEFSLKGGQANGLKFDALAKDYIAFFKELEYPYSIVGNRVRFGETGRAIFGIFYDSHEAYFGSNDLQKLATQKGMAEQLAGLQGKLLELITGAERSMWEAKSNMTYMPTSETDSDQQ